MKRGAIGLSLMLVFVFSACQKYKQNQPAYLSFDWSFSSNNFDESKVVLTSGFFYSSQVNVDGTRTGAPSVSLEQNFPVQKVSLQNSGATGLSLDVPVGDYSDFKVKIKVDASSKPCFGLSGYYFNGSDSIPVLIEWNTTDPMVFAALNGFSLKKKKDYIVQLDLNVNRLFSSVSSLQWNQASTSLENGVPTYVVRSTFNAGIFDDINEQLIEAFSLSVQ